jgi:hypothetical protein
LVTWLDNHDFGPNNDWNRRYGGTDQNLAACMNFMFTWRGIPVVYYGTESRFMSGAYTDIHDASGIEKSINLTGRAYYGDHMAAAPNHVIYQHIKKLNQMRKAIPALQNGTWQWAGGDHANGVGYIRKSGSSEVAVGLAKDDPVTFNFTGLTNGIYRDAVGGAVANVTDGTLSFTVQPGSAGIYVLNGPGIIGGNGVGFFQSGPGGTSLPIVNIMPSGGNYQNPVQVTMSALNTTGTSTIYYTTDGSIPTTASGIYTGPFTVSSPMTVKAIVKNQNGVISEMSSNTYTFNPIVNVEIFFKKPAAWNNTVRIHHWNTNTGTPPNSASSWPGIPMTNLGNDWFGYTFTGITSTSLLFNDGGSNLQTVDLSRDRTGFFITTGTTIENGLNKYLGT